MPDTPPATQWKTLDQDLNRLSRLEDATMYTARPLVGVGISLVFVTLAAVAAAIFTGGEPQGLAVVVAAAFGAYMALNIGANDVANNMGPAVGAKALSMLGAIAIAAVFESAGALLAGGDVVSTISKGIIDPASLADTRVFVRAMMAALLAASIWVNTATWIGAPVSTTHSVVGGVMGAGIVAAGVGAVSWSTMGAIAASWVISPLLGGIIAAAMLAFIKWRVIYVEDKIAAARTWVPVLIGLMSAAFAAYLALKGLSHVVKIGLGTALLIGGAAGVLLGALSVPFIKRQSEGLENRNRSLKTLFRLPLVVSAALLSFAHGANDVANAVGPLAAVVYVQQSSAVAGEVSIPLWVMLLGALGISFGLVLFGPKLIGMVGSQITKLNPMRAYCVALSAAVTVIAASWLGLPVSSTHIAVGGVFGVGFFREWYMERRFRRMYNARPAPERLARQERTRRKLVRRSHFMTIVAAWVITVPAAALLSAGCFLMLQTLGF
ncbi:inorganic phosphate transporter [Salipiger thiooxidans]|uniref:inorganic phosphate transporter n=1 Tax=Salipiger thiooxidans TaxID=282683 RepID=UPI001A90111B|nr:inorganic phosphate transporter [Salipiger thiooxidans]MBN8189435.1 inorganic phosphate transporter [Salipiger thiooxidans]MBR9839677.1 inorganic phosphate transporter [Paracoccaceae bacterium]MCA0848034.1 inorganic phosphate transporter [Salipiger thiooxidans]